MGLMNVIAKVRNVLFGTVKFTETDQSKLALLHLGFELFTSANFKILLYGTNGKWLITTNICKIGNRIELSGKKKFESKTTIIGLGVINSAGREILCKKLLLTGVLPGEDLLVTYTLNLR